MKAHAEVSAPQQPAAADNLVALLLERAREPAKVAASHKRAGRWEDVTWGRILEEVKVLSAGLVAQGVRPGDRVALFAATSLQWVVCDLAVSAAQAISVPVYSSNTPDEVRYILNHAEASLVFVDHDERDAKQAGRVSRLRARLEQCPTVRSVVLFEGAPAGGRETTLAALLAQGEAAQRASPAAFDERARAVSASDPCCFIYTSGTTGDPKGVILTHGNWAYEASGVRSIGMMEPVDSVMLFLPLAHSFAQVIKAAWLAMGFRMVFAESVEKLLANLVEARPSVLPAVPRVYEKVYNNVVANGSAAPGLKGHLFRWAFRHFDAYVEARERGRSYASPGFALAQRLVFAKVRATLGEKLGGNMRLFISGGAPLSRKIAYFFDLLGFKVLEGYGLTETSAGTTVNRPERIRIGTVGAPFPGTQVRIAPDGEILLQGPGLMKGYYKNPEATAEAIDAEGWLHTGDIGELDPDGYVRITDRKKDIIVTAGGKNVAPQNLENQLKTFPLISQAMVHGDRRRYLVLLATLNEEVARKRLTDLGVPAPASYAELAARPELQAAVQEILDRINADQPPYASLKRFALLPADLTQETGELTPTLKVKRRFCAQKYAAELERLYDGERLV